jgi:hypothetical protein
VSLLSIVSAFVLAAIPGFAGTKIVQRWINNEEPRPELKRILVMAVLENYLIRQALEDEIENRFAQSGVEGVKSHMVLPPRNELSEGELEQRIKESGFDAILVIRPVESRKETKEIVNTFRTPYVPPQYYYNFWPYWRTSWAQGYATTSEKTVVRAEFNLYYAKDEKLLWSGETDTIYSKDFGKLGREYAKALMKQLEKDGIIKRKS